MAFLDIFTMCSKEHSLGNKEHANVVQFSKVKFIQKSFFADRDTPIYSNNEAKSDYVFSIDLTEGKTFSVEQKFS